MGGTKVKTDNAARRSPGPTACAGILEGVREYIGAFSGVFGES